MIFCSLYRSHNRTNMITFLFSNNISLWWIWELQLWCFASCFDGLDKHPQSGESSRLTQKGLWTHGFTRYDFLKPKLVWRRSILLGNNLEGFCVKSYRLWQGLSGESSIWGSANPSINPRAEPHTDSRHMCHGLKSQKYWTWSFLFGKNGQYWWLYNKFNSSVWGEFGWMGDTHVICIHIAPTFCCWCHFQTHKKRHPIQF